MTGRTPRGSPVAGAAKPAMTSDRRSGGLFIDSLSVSGIDLPI